MVAEAGASRRSRGSRVSRLVASMVLALLTIGTGPGAQAHSELVSSSPAAGSVVTRATDRVVLVFASDLLPGASAVVVRDPRGRDVTTSAAGSRAAVVEATVRLGVGGRHDVSYRVVGEDGHVISGSLWFTVAGGAAPVGAAVAVPPDPEVSPGSTPGSGSITWIVLASLVCVALGVHVLGAPSRRRARDSRGRVDSAP
ncbi:copper resistance CopC family protein [Nocardioides sediminis]|uniref:copper resistance CopC family protein n=1 Tax=Nocardioides sediminis TaxID=433648 RepID=UPI000D321F97|nr:copper resistance CopC family protein [Nocardioides sediminis]